MSDEGLINKQQVARLLDCTTRQIERYERDEESPLPIAIRAPVGSKAGHKYCPHAVMLWKVGDSSDTAPGEYDYNRERARLTNAQADKTELEVKEIRGEVVRMPLIEQHWQGMVSAMRAKLLALPSKAAAMVAAPDKLQAVTDTLQGMVYEALAEIAGDGIPDEVRNRIAAQHRATNEGDREAAPKADPKPVGSGKADLKPGRQRGARKVPAK